MARRDWLSAPRFLGELVRRDLTLGLAALCIGGGQGIAMLVERVR